MKKFFLIITVILSNPIFSQDKKDLKKAFVSVGAQTSLAVGDLADTHSLGLGANVQGGYRVTNNLSVTGRISYTHLFGKKFSGGYYEPGGGGGSYSGRYEGMNDFGLTGGGRINFNENWFGGLEGGICIDSGGGHSETAGMGSLEFGYGFHCHQSPLEQAIAFFMGVCGDPKIQIGLRYSIRL
jgi:hypothetical protein